MSADYYDLLGVSRGADEAEIKRAFRKRARELHPDVNPDDPQAEARFREVTAAYEVLSDSERRALYDRYGVEGLKQQHWQPHFASFNNIGDIFSAFFGDEFLGGAMRGRPRDGRGDNVVVSAQLDFSEAALGTTRDIEYDAVVSCDQCAGSGASSPDATARCEQCDGRGSTRTVARSIFGQIVQESTCPRCQGRGSVITSPCVTCGGSGETVAREEITVDIPGGIADGQRIRLSGRGGTGTNGGPAGNLYIDISVRPDERFVREGDDLISVLELTMAEAALGCTKAVETVDGDDADVDFRPGVQPGEIVRLSGRGVRRLRGGGRGDHAIVVDVMVPVELSAEQRQLLERFAASETERNYRSDESVLDKLRRVLRPS